MPYSRLSVVGLGRRRLAPGVDAAALLAAQVHDDAAVVVGDAPQGRPQLRAAVAAVRAEHVAGDALAVHPHEHAVDAGDVAPHEGQVLDAVEAAAEAHAAERAPTRWGGSSRRRGRRAARCGGGSGSGRRSTIMSRPWRAANVSRSARRAMPCLVSSTTSHSTPAGRQPASRARSSGGLGVAGPLEHAALAGLQGEDVARAAAGPRAGCAGSIRPRMVAARSEAEMPVVVTPRRSTDTRKAVRWVSVLRSTIGPRSSSAARSAVIDTQITPDVWCRKKAMASGVANSAAMMRSPSFSRSSSSTTTTISPRATAAMASVDAGERHASHPLSRCAGPIDG